MRSSWRSKAHTSAASLMCESERCAMSTRSIDAQRAPRVPAALARVRAGLGVAAIRHAFLVLDLLVDRTVGDAGVAAFLVLRFRSAVTFGLFHVRLTVGCVGVCHA